MSVTPKPSANIWKTNESLPNLTFHRSKNSEFTPVQPAGTGKLYIIQWVNVLERGLGVTNVREKAPKPLKSHDVEPECGNPGTSHFLLLRNLLDLLHRINHTARTVDWRSMRAGCVRELLIPLPSACL